MDGSPIRVLESTFVVAPNPVEWYGQTLQSKQDWINTLEQRGNEQKWPAVGNVVNPKKIVREISQQTGGPPKTGRTGQGNRLHVNICKIQNEVKAAQLNDPGTQKLNKATELLIEGARGKRPKSRKKSIDKLTRLNHNQRSALKKHGGVTFQEDKDGRHRFNTKDALPLNNDLIQSKHISAEMLAAYMLVTYSYPADIAEEVKKLHELKPPDKQKRTYVARQKQDSSSDESGAED